MSESLYHLESIKSWHPNFESYPRPLQLMLLSKDQSNSFSDLSSFPKADQEKWQFVSNAQANFNKRPRVYKTSITQFEARNLSLNFNLQSYDPHSIFGKNVIVCSGLYNFPEVVKTDEEITLLIDDWVSWLLFKGLLASNQYDTEGNETIDDFDPTQGHYLDHWLKFLYHLYCNVLCSTNLYPKFYDQAINLIRYLPPNFKGIAIVKNQLETLNDFHSENWSSLNFEEPKINYHIWLNSIPLGLGMIPLSQELNLLPKVIIPIFRGEVREALMGRYRIKELGKTFYPKERLIAIRTELETTYLNGESSDLLIPIISREYSQESFLELQTRFPNKTPYGIAEIWSVVNFISRINTDILNSGNELVTVINEDSFDRLMIKALIFVELGFFSSKEKAKRWIVSSHVLRDKNHNLQGKKISLSSLSAKMRKVKSFNSDWKDIEKQIDMMMENKIS